MRRTAIIHSFKEYLSIRFHSTNTTKNYASDVKLFLHWLSSKKIRFFSEINSSLINDYVNVLKSEGKNISSINRALAALRTFFSFAITQQWLKTNPAKKIRNISPADKNIKNEKSITKQFTRSLVIGFERNLRKDKLSPATVKNYLSDIRQFTDWLESQLTD